MKYLVILFGFAWSELSWSQTPESPPSEPPSNVELMIQEFEKAGYQVEKLPSGQIVVGQPGNEPDEIKRRTEKSENPVDPAEYEKFENYQHVVNFNVGGGIGSTNSKEFEGHLPTNSPTQINKRNNEMSFELGIRIPAQKLKRLLMGVRWGGVQTDYVLPAKADVAKLPLEEQVVYAGKGNSLEMDYAFFAEWDILTIRKIQSSISAGGYYGRSQISVGNSYEQYQLEAIKVTESGAQLRWRSFIYDNQLGINIFGTFRVNQHLSPAAVIGMGFTFGPIMGFQRRTEK